ncbi:DUF6268 family outer membrane beta-barrel protein [Shewanella waksmanii]|uniref:DUF6268 family outer membrane beta-barrel protein n=1 Tax=Shewanella waksmanii TaxID=213783 RepID=UPI0004920D24|nr:DUF6268 family outer membrane beta-barrel protein [Shewanella waksmanii]
MNFVKLSTVVVASSLLSAPSYAAGKPYSPFSVSVSRISTFEADVGDQGQNLQRDTWLLGAKTGIPINRQWSIGLNVNYDKLNFDWAQSNQTLFANNIAPWGDVDRYGAGLSLMYRPNAQWMFMLAPKLQYAYADGASSSNAQSYGVVASGMYRFGNGNLLGLGVAYLNDISEVRTVPYLAVNWQISEQLKLSNPFSAGFSGPAGLELSYQFTDTIDMGFGASKRTQRFLVADDEQTIEIDEWVSFLRAGWAVTDSLMLNGYAGYYFNSEMELNSPEIVEEIDNQTALALALEYKF